VRHADANPRELVGLIRVNDHCLFTWRGLAPEDFDGEGPPPRTVEVREDHCQPCVDEVTGGLGFNALDTRDQAAGVAELSRAARGSAF
jgi:hypothetical protein